MDVLEVLKKVKVFSELDAEALGRLASQAWVAEYSANEVIIHRGDQVESAGVLVSGQVIVSPGAGDDACPAIELEEGQIFGEMSLLTGEPALADVIARASSRVVHVPHVALSAEIGKNPRAAQPLARLLTKRLAARNGSAEAQRAVAQARADAGQKRLLPTQSIKGHVLVLNLGSSSIKFTVYVAGERKAAGIVQRVGLKGTRIEFESPRGKVDREIPAKDHEQGLGAVLELLVDPELGVMQRFEELAAVGHRVVHGGVEFTTSTVVDEAVMKTLVRMSKLAPLHNPINILGIELCQKLLPPSLPQVCVFDTAFHQTMPEHAYRYGLPIPFADEHMVRRFGFHGTSHRYVAQTGGNFLGPGAGALKMITCHLGNGASITAVDHGRSVDTSMGLTPLEGLLMGTRSGDLDPGALLALLDWGQTRDGLDTLLNKQSGLLGISGVTSDMRELEKLADAGQPGALLAIQMFCYRIRKYVGAYTAAMGGMDALIFTGGIGEHSAGVRARVCNELGCLGIHIDQEKNRARVPAGALAMDISAEGSAVHVLVVPTDEEWMIASETIEALKRSGVAEILSARRDRPIPIGVSAHHVHLTQAHVEALFGPGHTLHRRNDLSQPGQFACEETVHLIGPKGRVDDVRVLGPVRPLTQVEISRTEEYKLGIDAPIRASGDLKGSPGLTLQGSAGKIELSEGAICALRHIHMSPQDALSFGLKDRDLVRVNVEGERPLIFGGVLVRVHPEFKLEMHLDTDEANAAEVNAGMKAMIESVQHRAV